MKSFRQFNEMKEVSKMSNSEIEKWLGKTSKSLASYARKGGPNTMRGYDLRDRFDELKQEMINRGINFNQFCKKQGWGDNVCSIDFFA